MSTSGKPQVQDPFFRELVRTTGYLVPLHARLWFLSLLLGFAGLLLALSRESKTPMLIPSLCLLAVVLVVQGVQLLRSLGNKQQHVFLLTPLKPVPPTPVQPIHWFARFAPLLLVLSAAYVFFGDTAR